MLVYNIPIIGTRAAKAVTAAVNWNKQAPL